MKIKKIFAFILSSAILISSLSLHTSADSVAVINGNNPINFPGQNISLNSDIKCEIKGFSANPYKVPGLPAFISGKCEVKIDPSKLSPDNQYYGNGGYILIFLIMAHVMLCINFFDWENFLSTKSKNNINTLKINGPKPSILKPLNDAFALFNPFDPTASFISFILWLAGIGFPFWYFNLSIAKILGAIGAMVLPPLSNGLFKLINKIIAPLNNLLNNTNSVDFYYGIVLTDKDDELVLDANNLPKPGDINVKALRDWQKKQNKENQILIENHLKAEGSNAFREFMGYNGKIKIPDNCYYTQQDIVKMKQTIEKHKDITYAKLANSTPITDGFVCKLDREHPSQTFRLVINNQFPNNPNNADLFALALKNNNINLAQTDSRINFTAVYTPLASDDDFMARLSNASFETQQKVNFIKNVGDHGFLSKTFSNIIKWFKNHFSLWSQEVPEGGAAVGGQPGPGQPPAGAAAAGGQPGPGQPPAGAGHPPRGMPFPQQYNIVDPRINNQPQIIIMPPYMMPPFPRPRYNPPPARQVQ